MEKNTIQQELAKKFVKSEEKLLSLPSPYQINDQVWINFWEKSIIGKVIGVHFYSNKIKYDLEVFCFGNGGSTRIYNIDGNVLSGKLPH